MIVGLLWPKITVMKCALDYSDKILSSYFFADHQCKRFRRKLWTTRKLSLEVAPTISNILADHGFSAGRYLFTVSNSGLLFSYRPPVPWISQLHFHFSIKKMHVTVTYELDLHIVMMNRCIKYLGQSLVCLKLSFAHMHTHTHTHTQWPIALHVH